MVKITNANQFPRLVAELEKNPALAKGFTKGSVPVDFNDQWQAIATIVNALGPPIRDGDGWKKVWRDLKCKVKKKLVHNKSKCRSTGGRTFQKMVLSPLEEQVANLMQFGKQLGPKGVEGIPECETATTSRQQVNITSTEEMKAESPPISSPDLDATIVFDEMAFPHNSAMRNRDVRLHEMGDIEQSRVVRNEDSIAHTSTRSRSRDRSQQQTLLASHSATPERLLTNISSSFERMENKLDSMERTQTSTSHILGELVEIERKKLKIMERQQEREEALYKSEMRLKGIKIQIKEAELDLVGIRKSRMYLNADLFDLK